MSTPSHTTPKLQQIAFTIRDWLGPFYTLGGVVAFAIFLLSLLDPTGRLLQVVQVVLLVATALALAAFFLLRNRLGPLAQRFFGVHGHWLLCLVCAFFASGLLISNWIQRERHVPIAAPAPAPASTAPSTPDHTPFVEPAPVREPETAAPAVSVPAIEPLAEPAPVRKPEPRPATAARPAPSPAPVATPAPQAAPKAAVRQERQPSNPAQQARCARLVQRLGLGESLTGDELNELRRSCGS